MPFLGVGIGLGLQKAGGSGIIGLQPSFYAPLSSTLVLKKGIGTYNFSNTTGDGKRSVTDFEGIVHTDILKEEARFQGVRRVRNLVTGDSENLDASAPTWSNVNTGDLTNNVLTITNTNDGFSGSSINVVEGDTIIVSVDMTSTENWDDFEFDPLGTATVSPTEYTLSPKAGVRQRFACKFTVNAAGGGTFISRLRCRDTSPSGYTATIHNIQIENVTGQTVGEQGFPSEYVSVGVGTGNELLPDASFDLPINDPNGWDTLFGSPITSNGELVIPNSGGANATTPVLPTKVGKVYTVSGVIEEVGSSANISFGSTAFWATADGPGYFSKTLPIGNATSEFAIINSSGTLRVSEISAKEVDHGANVDGVKYFDYHNLNTVDANKVVTDNGQGSKFGRRVEVLDVTNVRQSTGFGTPNHFTLTEDKTDPFGGNEAVSISTVATGTPSYRNNTVPVNGRTVRNTLWIKHVAGSASGWRMYNGTANGTTALPALTTGVWQRMTVDGQTSATTGSIGIGRSDTTAGNEIHIYHAQCEVVENTTDTPSEQVFYGEETFPFSGTGLNGVAEFSTSNPNRVVNNEVLADQPTYPRTPGDGVLIETAGKNLCLHSEDFTTTWVNFNTDAPTTNNTAPSGFNNADEIASTDAIDQQHAIYQSFTGLTAATPTTVSCYLKPGTNATMVQLAFDSDGTGVDGFFCNFNVETGASGTATVMTAGTATNETIELIGNGWYRCSVTGTIASGTVGRLTLNIIDNISAVKFEASALADNDSILAWGAQVEVGPFPSSYIPTTTPAVDRLADSLYYSNDNFSDTTGSLVITSTFYNPIAPNKAIVSQNSNSASVLYVNNGVPRGYDGLNPCNTPGGALSYGEERKYCVTWDANNLSTGLRATDNGATPNFSAYDGSMNKAGDLTISKYNSCNMTIKDFYLYKKALDDAKMQEKTK